MIDALAIPKQEAIQIGRTFLDSIGAETGIVLNIRLEREAPNFYWQELAGLEKPNIRMPRLCWIIPFEQKYRAGHFFEVWMDAGNGEVIGGTQCR